MRQIDRLLEIMAALRHPETGCPWDLQQSYATIVPHTLEEAYEVADAIEREDMEELKDELGDLLFQVVFYAQLAREEGLFDFEDVAGAIAEKITRRHPHVFGDAEERDAESQRHAWEAIKAEERAARRDAGPGSVLDGVALALPGLSRAVKLQQRAARVGFDWDSAEPVFDKVREELRELQAEVEQDGGNEALEDELGDLLFASANLARHLGVDPEQAIRRTSRKFERRFRRLEELIREGRGSVEQAGFEALESAYQEAKREERGETGNAADAEGAGD